MNEIAEIDYKTELKKCKTMEDVVGKNGLMQKLLKDVMQNLLEAEMSAHLGRDKYERNEETPKNYRNGHVPPKTVKTSLGEIEVESPRDRNGEFEPQILQRYKTVCNDLDKKVIGLYAKGMSTRDIKTELEELYGINVSPSMISMITDKVLGDAAQWQNRTLDKVYPIVYLDAVHFKVKQDDGRIVSKASYICLGINQSGFKDVLGIWVGESEGAKFWLSVCNELKKRGVEDILITCIDGLKGFPDAIKTVFPNTTIQTCVIHQIRNSIKYIASKDQKPFMADLKPVYKAASEEIALQQLQLLENKWGKKYGVVMSSWYNNWENLSTYFQYPENIKRIIYTTNTLEGFNRQLRKATKVKTMFPSDEALKKSLYLATGDIMKKWTMPVANWAQTIAQFSIIFGERMPLDI
jgi:putative transposase